MSDSNQMLDRSMWWIREAVNPVLPPLPESTYECGRCMNPFVLRVDDEYYLYYSGADAEGHQRICLATASVEDPTDWIRQGVVLDRGEDGDFDYNWVVLPHVVKFPDRWHLYYTANSGYGEGLAAFPGIGLAFSEDGKTFQKYENNPILSASHVEGDPDCQGVAGGSVIQVRLPDGGTEWRFYYTGCPTLGDDVFLNQQKTVCYAVSQDGIEWKKQGAVMFRNANRDYINVAAAGPVVWQEEDGSFRMLLSAIGTRWGFYSICYAESEDGVVWRQGEHYGDDLTLGPTGDGWERQMVAYPSVVQEGSRLRLFYCGNGYGRTGIGTAVSSSLRASAVEGQCELRIAAPEARVNWIYRVPEGLSCDEGMFKSHFYPVVDWHGPTEEGVLWHEWETSEEDLAVFNTHEHVRTLGLNFIRGIWYRVLVRHVEYGLELKFTAKNLSDEIFHNVVGIPCLGYPPAYFQDSDLERTFAQVGDVLTPLKETDRGTGDARRTHYLVEGQRPVRYYAPPFWGELSKTTVMGGALLRSSVDGRFTVGTAWEAVAEVWDNQDAHACMHSNFTLGDLVPGETKSVKGRIVFVEGKPEDALPLLTF